ncbi:MAG TPA: hypothetical protein VMB50_08965, partial [Myxococcales bacterium]|nr:hypothetical protein [Myxococcales bacterium]
MSLMSRVAPASFTAVRRAPGLVAVLLCLPSIARATTRYIAQTAGTFTGGIACNGRTAITPAAFNALTPGPGDVNYLCGTITIPANTEGLIVNGSGAAGNPITIYFDSGAVLQSPYWPGAGSGAAIDTAGNDYVTVDGNGGANGYTEGVIQATLNGNPGATCPGGPCQYQNDSVAVQNNGGSNFVLQGLT